MQTCLRLCARQVTTNLARQWTLQSSSSCVMAPKKTPTVDTKQVRQRLARSARNLGPGPQKL